MKLAYSAAIFSGAPCYVANTYRYPSATTALSHGGFQGEDNVEAQLPPDTFLLGLPINTFFPCLLFFPQRLTKKGTCNLETAAHTAVLSRAHFRTRRKTFHLANPILSRVLFYVQLHPLKLLVSLLGLELAAWVLEENKMAFL